MDKFSPGPAGALSFYTLIICVKIMDIALHVSSAPYSSQANLTAHNFAKAAIEKGHNVTRIFFSSDAVLTGSSLTIPPQDEINLSEAWSDLAKTGNTELILCISACLRRGIVDETEAERYQLAGNNLRPGFIISGLGQLAEAAIMNDRLVTFGA